MAQRISRAKRTVGRAGVDRPGDVRTVMRVLYLVFNEGYSGDVDLAAEAIRLTRQLAALVDDPEVHGLARPDAPAPRPPPQPHPTGRKHRAARRSGPQPVGHRAHRRGDRHRTGCAGARSARRVPGASGDRRAPCRRAACRGDRLGPDRGVVRRAAPVRRHADRPAQPCGRGRRGRRRARRAGGTGRGRRTTSRGAKRSPRTSTRRTAISSSRPASTPTRLATHPTSPNATTRRARPARLNQHLQHRS